MSDTKYLISNALKRSNEIPLLYLESIRNLDNATKNRRFEKELSAAETVVLDFLQQVTVKRLSALHKSVVFDFNITGTSIEYSYNEIEKAIKDNIDNSTRKVVEASSELVKRIVEFAVRPVDNIFDFHRDDQGNMPIKRNETLEKFIQILESQTYDNIWSDLMKYPFDNQKHGIRKHLILGTRASTGKTIVLECMAKLLEAAAIWKENRPISTFDAANWNADVIDKFVVLIDDDDPQKPVTEDYIKNFMNNNMPIPLARTGVRWSELYNGSSVIATNNAQPFFKDKQNDKRIIFIKLDKNIEKEFNFEELNYLHNIPVENILAYVTDDETQLYSHVNDWNGVIEDDTDEILQYIKARGRVTTKEMNLEFGKAEVKKAVKKAGLKAQTFTMDGESCYGYVDSTGVIDEPYKVDQLTFAAFQSLQDSIGERNFESPEEFKKEVIEFGKLEKEKQPLFSPAVYHDNLKKGNVTGYVGVVLDIDGANASNMDDLERKINNTGMSAIAWETSSSNAESLRARVWFYRIGGELGEYKQLVKLLSAKIDEPFDSASAPVEHRFFVGGTNVRLINTGAKEVKGMTSNNKRSILSKVKNAEDGNREATAYWALMVTKQETGDTDFMNEIIDKSEMSDKNKTKLRRQFEL